MTADVDLVWTFFTHYYLIIKYPQAESAVSRALSSCEVHLEAGPPPGPRGGQAEDGGQDPLPILRSQGSCGLIERGSSKGGRLGSDGSCP